MSEEAVEVERRLLSPEPKLIMALKKRKTIIPRGMIRTATLNFLEDVARNLRNRESWVEDTAATTRSFTIQLVLTRILRFLGVSI